MAGEWELMRPLVPRLGGLYGFLPLLGASAVVFAGVGEPKPSVFVRAGCALAGFVLWLVGVALVVLHIQGPQDLKPRFVVSSPGSAQEQGLQRPIPRLSDLYGFLTMLGASVVVISVIGEPKPSIHAVCALSGFVLWLVGAALVLLHIQGAQNLKPRFFFSGPEAQELQRPIPRLGDFVGFLALLSSSVVVWSVTGKPKPSPSVHAVCALAGFVLWLLGVAFVVLRVQGPQNLNRFAVSGPGAPAQAQA